MSFTDLVDSSQLRELMESGTGRGVRIGILDSGVNPDLPELEGSVKANFEVPQTGDTAKVVPATFAEDTIAHGTACASIIHKYAPDAELFSIQVIGKNHAASTPQLVAALEFAIDQQWDILNVSIGNETLTTEIAALADRAFYQKSLMIAAKDNKPDKIGYPAACASVLAVDMDFFEDPFEFRYLENNPTEIEASGVYIDCPLPDGDRQSYTGSSFACPHITAIAARLRQHFPGLSMTDLKIALRALSTPK